MVALALGHEHRIYKGPYAGFEPNPQILNPIRSRRRKRPAAAFIMSAIGIFS